MLGTTGTRDATILFKGESTHIVLINDVLIDGISLAFKEVSHPENISNLIVDGNKFGFSGAFGVDLLLAGRAGNGTFAQCHE